VSGLSAAAALERLLPAGSEITVLEAEGRVGGNIETVHDAGYTFDGGPDSWVVTKPHAHALAKRLGVDGDLIGTNPDTRKVYIAHQGRLHSMPEGLVLGVPTEITPMLQTDLFSWDQKLRMGLDLLTPRKVFGPNDDESISAFVTRRLGEDVADRLVGPLLSGIFAGDADELSIRASFPQFVDAEAKYGSLILAMRAQMKERQKARPEGAATPSMFSTMKGGHGDFIDALFRSLKTTQVKLRQRVSEVRPSVGAERALGRYMVHTEGSALPADAVLITSPLYATARMLKNVAPSVSAQLSAFRYASTATLFLGYREDQVPRALDATGFIVPRSAGSPLLASTWVSSKWAGRAPEGHVLLRVFFGGARGASWAHESDEALLRVARRELATFMDIEATPQTFRVFRFVDRSPQPYVGHLGRVAKLRAGLLEHPGLFVVANGLDGAGIPDCIKHAEMAAESMAALGPPG
jgi:oxygen-dependent protoporphyrinogen oxidase